MIYLIYAVNFLLMMAMPLILAWFIAKKRQIRWGLFGIGALSFVLSQIGHIPFNWLVLQKLAWVPMDNLMALAIFAGLSAGVFEESLRYAAYRFWAKDARTWGTGLMLGAGHGGVEAILIGVLGAVNVAALALMGNGRLLNLVPAEQLPLVQAQITAVFSAPWYQILLGALERLFAITMHLAFSLLVMQQFVRGQRRWVWLAILWHAAVDATAVYAAATWGPYLTEAIIGVMAFISLGVIFRLKTPEPAEPELEPLPEVSPASPIPLELTADSLDESRYL